MAGRVAKRLYGPAQLAAVAATVYTVPANRRAIVRHIHLSNPTAGALTITLSIGVSAAGTRIFDAYAIAAGAVLDHFCYYILEAAEVIQGGASAATSIVVTISGDEEVLS